MNCKVGKNFSCNNASGKRNKGDFYQTPYGLTRLLLDEIRGELGTSFVLEPCCGEGAIVTVLKESGINCVYIDIKYDTDFLDSTLKKENTAFPWIITNPPYSLAFEFIQKAKEVCNNFAFLLPLSYLHGKKRYEEIYKDTQFPLTDVYWFVRRPMLKDTIREDGKHETGMMEYAWFIWKRGGDSTGPKGHWLDNDPYVVRGK